MAVDTTAHTSNTIKRKGIMKYYFILTDGKDAWMQFVYLLREIMCPAISVTCGAWEYPCMTMTFGLRTHAPLPSVPLNAYRSV